MAGYPETSSIAAYRSVATHGAVDSASPHQLVALLMDGALERLSSARGCIERKESVKKALLLQRVGAIVDELSANLDYSAGGEIAENLGQLYDYMLRRILFANLNNNVAAIDEVTHLLREVRQAWGAIPAQSRPAGKSL